MARRRTSLCPLALTALLALAGCNTAPTLPLPPPVVSVPEFTQAGLVRVSGTSLERAYVSVLNTDTDQGVITRADDLGAWATEIAASPGDRMTVFQEVDGEDGEHVDVGVPQN